MKERIIDTAVGAVIISAFILISLLIVSLLKESAVAVAFAIGSACIVICLSYGIGSLVREYVKEYKPNKH